MKSVERPVALVTGGGRGIGLGISKALIQNGFDLAFCGVRPRNSVESLEELAKSGARVLYVQADVSSAEDRARLIKEVRNEFGRLDLLVNNAGVAPLQRKDILDADQESFRRLIGINLEGPYFLTQLAARWMVETKGNQADFTGCIVFVTSISATIPSTNRGDYCISKSGLSMACKLWAARLAEYEIRVYEVRPGIVRTDMTAGVRQNYDQMIADGLLLQPRWGLPEDIGRAVAMLARGDLSYSTGQVLNVDGFPTRNIL